VQPQQQQEQQQQQQQDLSSWPQRVQQLHAAAWQQQACSRVRQLSWRQWHIIVWLAPGGT
jgi:hypothetical protein